MCFQLQALINRAVVLFISLLMLSNSSAASAVIYELKIAQQSVTSSQDAAFAEAERLTNEGLQLLEQGLQLFQQGTAESLIKARKKFQAALLLWQKLGDKELQAITLVLIGRIYDDLGEKQKALSFYNQALPLSRALGDKGVEATILSNIAAVYSSLGKKQKALQFLNQALLLNAAVEDRNGEAIILNNIAEVYDDLGEKQKALQFYNQALHILHIVENKRLEATILSNVGAVYQSLGEKRKALQFYNQALPISRAVGDKSGEATTLNNIGLTYSDLGEKQKALQFYNQALPIQHMVRDKYGEAITLSNIGLIYSDLGDKQKALQYYNRALPIFRSLENIGGEAGTLTNIGGVYKDLGDKQKALQYFKQALPVLHAIGDKRGEAVTLHNIGIIYQSLGEEDKALQYYNQALPLLNAVGDKGGKATILNAIGSVYSGLGDKYKALQYYHQALPTLQVVRDKRGEAAILHNIGTIYHSLEENDKALQYYNQALPLLNAVGDRGREAITLNNIGRVYKDLGEKQKALSFYNQALSLSRAVDEKDNESLILGNLAVLERDRNNLQASLQHIKTVIQIIEKLRGTYTNQDLKTKYFATVQGYYKLYIDLLMQLNKKDPSKGYAALAFNVSERSRARGLLELLTEARADIRKGANPELLAEESRLLQLISAKEKLRSKIVNDKNKTKDLVTKTAAERLNQEIANLLEEYKQLQLKIKQSNPKYAALKYPEPLKLREIQQQLDKDSLLLQYSLGEERSFLWVVSPDSFDTYELPKKSEIDKSAIKLFCLISQKSSKPPSATGIENPCTNLKTRRIDLAAEELSKLVLAPIKHKLGKKRLVVVADGALQYIPFAALADLTAESGSKQGNEEKDKLSNGGEIVSSDNRGGGVIPEIDTSAQHFDYQPLLINHEIINLPSASTIAIQRRELANRKKAPKALAILADPVFSATDSRVTESAQNKQLNNQNSLDLELEDSALKRSANILNRQSWGKLDGTRKEAENILKLVPDGDRLQVFDFDANYNWATSSELNQYRILHFATHGFVNDVNPELSGIVLSLVDKQGKRIRGYLRLGDLFNLDYPADLIVLSACETGLGKEIQGEGLVGLTRGLMYAGAERLVVSLWQVDDKATAEFMQEFYKQMLENGKSANEALRATQLKMRKQENRQEPYYWAAFTFLGEWR